MTLGRFLLWNTLGCLLLKREKCTFHVRIDFFWPSRDGWHAGNIWRHRSVWCARGASWDSWGGILSKKGKAAFIKPWKLHFTEATIWTLLYNCPHLFCWSLHAASPGQKCSATVSSLLEHQGPSHFSILIFPWSVVINRSVGVRSRLQSGLASYPTNV